MTRRSRAAAQLLPRIPWVALCAGLLLGCATAPRGGYMPGVDLRQYQPLYVVHQPQDGRQIHEVIAAELERRRFAVSYGEAADRPPDAKAIVVYEDRWQFDMRMYLIHLRVDVRDAETNVLLATSQSYQSSLEAIGEPWQRIVERLVSELVLGEVGRGG